MVGFGSKLTRGSVAACAVSLVVSLGSPLALADEELFADAVASAADGRAYRVSGIVPAYAEEHPDHPDLATVLSAEVKLGQAEDGYVAPRKGVPTVVVKLADLADGLPGVYYASALAAVNRGLLLALNRQGLGGVTVQTNPADIDPTTGEDRRSGEEGTVGVEVSTGRISDLRVVEVETFCFGERCDPDESTGNPIHQRIKEQSPIQPGGSVGEGQTDLLRTDMLEDYVAYLNRHPGRRVVAEVSPSRMERGTAYVDFKIVEDKPWSVYTQGSNTGTRETQHWRQRTGYRHTQLTGRDDMLRLDWVTDGEGGSNVRGFFGSYEVPVGVGEIQRLRFAVNGAYSDYDASDLGSTNSRFTGRNHVAGGDLIYNVFQQRELFVDLVGGARWKNVRVKNKLIDLEGEEDYWLPSVGLRVSRDTDVSRLFADVGYARSMGGGSSLSESELNKLGRLGVDDSWATFRYFGRLDAFLDPFLASILPAGFDENRRGHELLLELKGQYTKDRLIPQEEQIAGGLYTVRGYDQAMLAGDSVFVSRSEYILHIPRLLGVRPQPEQLPWVGDFRVAPRHPGGRPDWDLTLNLFIDVATIDQNDRKSYEIEQSIWGWGFGAGIQFLRNASFQYYFGVAGRDIEDPLGLSKDLAERGDINQHIEFTVLF